MSGAALGVVAGGGILPRIVAREARALGWEPVVFAIADGRSERWDDFRSVSLPWSRTGDVFGLLRAHDVATVVFCGTISVRPDYRSIVPSLRTLRMLPELLRIARGGDDSLLRAVASIFERRGFAVLSVQDIVPNLLTPLGTLSRRAPTLTELRAVQRACVAATRLGELDIGQAAVASADRVIAVEGIEGTRDMLLRVGELRARGRIGNQEKTVLYKAFKPQQDERFDLPSIGIETVSQLQAAGISGVAMTAGRSLLVGIDDLLSAADAAELFVVGHEPTGRLDIW